MPETSPLTELYLQEGTLDLSKSGKRGVSASFSLGKDVVKKSPWKPCPASVLCSVTGSLKGMIKHSPKGLGSYALPSGGCSVWK